MTARRQRANLPSTGTRRPWSCSLPRLEANSLQVGPNILDQFFGRQAVGGAAASGHELEDAGALLLGFEGTHDGLKLSPHPPHARQEPSLLIGRESH